MDRERPDAIIVQASLPAKRIAELAVKYRIPAVAVVRGFVEEGGLMTYSAARRKVASAWPPNQIGTRPEDVDWTRKYPTIAGAVAALPAEQAYLDGELCGVRPDGAQVGQDSHGVAPAGGA